MQIQWYPGHMHKARQELKKVLPKADLIIEVLDARLPFSSENPLIAELRGARPCIKLFNKSDLADEFRTQQWQEYLDSQQGVKTFAINMHQQERISLIPELCKKLVPSRANGDTPLQAMIMGIPNAGKSTLINALAGRSIAKTGNEPAVTRFLQRIDLKNGVVLLDTPGMLWPNIENPQSGYRLAASGAIKDTAIEHDDVAFYIAEFLMHDYPRLAEERYQFDEMPQSELEFLEALGRKRGCLRGGNEVDLQKASRILIAELRSGQIGKVTLETPEMMLHEKEQVKTRRAEKEAKKAERQASRKRRKN